MVLAVIRSHGNVMLPHFFEAGKTVTKDIYLKVLRSKVIQWMNEMAEGDPYTFQQDLAPAHKAKMVQR